MKRIIALSTMGVFAFLAFAGALQAGQFLRRFSLKLGGGYGSMKTGDLAAIGNDLDVFYSDLAEGRGLTKERDISVPIAGAQLEAEIMMSLTQDFQIGVGVGFIRGSKDSRILLRQDDDVHLKGALSPKIGAFPVGLSFYYTYPILSSMKIYFKGGVHYLFGRIEAHSSYEEVGPSSSERQTDWEISDRGSGFRGGFGYEFGFSSGLVLFIEIEGRLCELKNWEGEGVFTDSNGTKTTSSGAAWLVEELNSATGEYYTRIMLSREKELIGPGLRNARTFEGDFSGISCRAGLRINF